MTDTVRVTTNAVAVDDTNEWQPVSTCPRNVKVQLLGGGGVAIYGTYDGKDPFWMGWAPLPRRPTNKETT